MLPKILPAIKQRIADRLHGLLERRIEKDVDRLLKTRLLQNKRFLEHLKVKLDAIDLENSALRGSKVLEDRYQLLELAIRAASENPDAKRGLWLEFGVNDARSVNFIAGKIPGTVYGFDSFEGLPEDWVKGSQKVIPKGSMSQNHHFPEHAKNVKFVKGWFSETLPPFVNEHPEPAVFVHIDSDLYSSAKCVLDHLNFAEGAVIVFDEYYNYPYWKDHEYKAFQEFLTAVGAEARCVGYNPSDKQVAFSVHFLNRTRPSAPHVEKIH